MKKKNRIGARVVVVIVRMAKGNNVKITEKECARESHTHIERVFFFWFFLNSTKRRQPSNHMFNLVCDVMSNENPKECERSNKKTNKQTRQPTEKYSLHF